MQRLIDACSPTLISSSYCRMKYSMVGGLSATSGLAVDPEPINEQCQRLYALNGVNDGTPLTLNKSGRSGDLT